MIPPSPQIILSGRGLKEARVNEEAEFIIDAKYAGPGAPIVHMKGTRSEQPVEIQSIMDRRYRCSYTPRVPGAYLLTIWWSERQLRGSPFKVGGPPSDYSSPKVSFFVSFFVSLFISLSTEPCEQNSN